MPQLGHYTYMGAWSTAYKRLGYFKGCRGTRTMFETDRQVFGIYLKLSATGLTMFRIGRPMFGIDKKIVGIDRILFGIDLKYYITNLIETVRIKLSFILLLCDVFF